MLLEFISSFPVFLFLFISKVALNSGMLEVYGGDQGMTASHGGLTPPSCPPKLSVKMEVTGTEHGCRKSAVDQLSLQGP